jgi:predicted O-methyltransferase YrrM
MDVWEEVGSELIHKQDGTDFFKKVGSEKFSAYKAHKRLGYVFNDNDKLVLKLIKEKSKDNVNVLEIGSFLGQGSKFFIRILEKHGMSPLVDSIDLMLPYLEEVSNVDYSYQGFHLLKNTIEERKAHKLFLHAGRSRDILPYLAKEFDFAYIDGEHTPGGVYLDLVLTLAKSGKGSVLLVDDMTWVDLKSVGSGVKVFMKQYANHIDKIYAHGEKAGQFGFHELSSGDELKLVKTDQILFVVKEGVSRTLDDVLHEIKKHRLHLNKEFNAGRRKTIRLKKMR